MNISRYLGQTTCIQIVISPNETTWLTLASSNFFRVEWRFSSWVSANGINERRERMDVVTCMFRKILGMFDGQFLVRSLYIPQLCCYQCLFEPLAVLLFFEILQRVVWSIRKRPPGTWLMLCRHFNGERHTCKLVPGALPWIFVNFCTVCSSVRDSVRVK